MELSKFTEVTLLCPNQCELQADFKIFKITKEILKKELVTADSVILQGVTLWQFPFIKKHNVPIIVDLYDPFMFENFEIDKGSSNSDDLHLSSLTIILDQLMAGDYFICASEKQRDLWIGMLTAINRINAKEYSIDPTLNHLISVVPFGMPAARPEITSRVLKGIYPGIEETDKVVIWGGGIWDWLDPLTAVLSINELSKEREDIKLFFMGIKHPNNKIPMTNKASETIRLSNSLDLTGKKVFFNEWVDYSERHNYLLESDIGLSLHENHVETRYAFRTRILDYLWCNLPVISNGGDTLSEIILKNKVGEVIPTNSPSQLAFAIKKLLESSVRREISDNFQRVGNDLHWNTTTKPLIKFCEEPKLSIGKNLAISNKSLYSDKRIKLIKLVKYLKRGDFKTIYMKIRGK
ncbi:hypothetical protein D3C81_849960 [compost metagenome]